MQNMFPGICLKYIYFNITIIYHQAKQTKPLKTPTPQTYTDKPNIQKPNHQKHS